MKSSILPGWSVAKTHQEAPHNFGFVTKQPCTSERRCDHHDASVKLASEEREMLLNTTLKSIQEALPQGVAYQI